MGVWEWRYLHQFPAITFGADGLISIQEATVNDTSISYCKIPDVDGDNITDGKEIKGYRVKIITGWKSDGTPISRTRYISPDEMDPLVLFL